MKLKNKIQKKDIKELILLISSFILGGIFTIILLVFSPLNLMLNSNNGITITKDKTKIYEKSSLSSAISKVEDAVITIMNDGDAIGSGFIYKVDNKYAYILTNEHVITGKDKVKISLSNDIEKESTVLGSDSYLDIAVLRTTKSDIKKVATLSSSDKTNIGDVVFTIGTPVDKEYKNTVTSGILSGKDRGVKTKISNYSNKDIVMNVLQIDASINSGNSGGPLLNANGEVIGICTLKITEDNVEGLGFAIPIETAKNHLKELENKKDIKHPTLNIETEDVEDKYEYKNNNKTLDYGVIIKKINKNSILEKTNIKENDVITKINNKKIRNYLYLNSELYKYNIGTTIDLTYIHNGSENKIKVTLTSSE